MQREDAPRLERYYAEERVKVALEELNSDFYVFQRMLSQAHILLDLNTLAQLAIYEPTSFQCLVDLAQKMALVDGEAVVQSPEELAHVQCDGSLFGQPFPEAKLYPEGPTENHLEVPRQLTLDEY
uniref:GPN-loop GTPase 2 n=1 Tax=Globodera pallida TaxID=36090 RepID=A0A183BPN5_GLOPA